MKALLENCISTLRSWRPHNKDAEIKQNSYNILRKYPRLVCDLGEFSEDIFEPTEFKLVDLWPFLGTDITTKLRRVGY